MRKVKYGTGFGSTITEADEIHPCLRSNAGGVRKGIGIKVPEATAQGYAVAGEGDSINLSQPNSKTRRGRVGVGVAQTIDTQMQQYTPVIYDDYNSRERTDGLTCAITPNTGASANRNGQKGIENMHIRRLTPTECEKLQGFPVDWTRYGHDGKEISDSQRYKMCGNAVSVPVVKAVMQRLFKTVREGQ